MAIDFRGMAPLLQVFDMPASLRFYRDVLGFEVLSTSGGGDESDWVLLRRGGVELMLNTAYEADARPATPDATRVAHHQDTCLFFGCRDLEAAYSHLLALGVPAEPPKVAPYGITQLYLTDPDGYGLCFQWPATEQGEAQWREWYASDRVAQEHVARRATGRDLAALRDRVTLSEETLDQIDGAIGERRR